MAREESPEFKAKKKLSSQEAFLKICSYCAYQERSHKEVKNKLYEYGLSTDDVNELIVRLINEKFLNEERFAKAFAGGKFRIKKWGRLKIINEMEMQGLSKNCISRGLGEIDDNDYRKTLQELIRKKAGQTTESNPFKKRDKIARFVIGKGYEAELVWEYVKDLVTE